MSVDVDRALVLVAQIRDVVAHDPVLDDPGVRRALLERLKLLRSELLAMEAIGVRPTGRLEDKILRGEL